MNPSPTTSHHDPTDLPPWREEIEELHRFFVDWFRGTLPRSPAGLSRLSESLDPELVFIAPTGEQHSADELLQGIEGAHGRRPGLEIQIREPEIRSASGALILASYEEWQREDELETGRITTVVFRRDPGGPNGLRWVHVHEGWLPGAAPGG